MKPSMEIFLGNLPPRATVDDLRSLLMAAVDRNSSRRLVQAILRGFDFDRDTRVQVIDTRSKRRRYRYGHVAVDDPYVARFFVEEVNGQRLGGNRLEAREFVRRANDYEDYAKLNAGPAWVGPERRGSHDGVPNSPISSSRRVKRK